MEALEENSAQALINAATVTVKVRFSRFTTLIARLGSVPPIIYIL